MAAGPSQKQVTNAIRNRLRQAQRAYGGEYVKGSKLTYAYLQGDGWKLTPRLLRASNGEAWLQWIANGNLGADTYAIELSLDAAAKRIGLISKLES